MQALLSGEQVNPAGPVRLNQAFRSKFELAGAHKVLRTVSRRPLDDCPGNQAIPRSCLLMKVSSGNGKTFVRMPNDHVLCGY